MSSQSVFHCLFHNQVWSSATGDGMERGVQCCCIKCIQEYKMHICSLCYCFSPLCINNAFPGVCVYYVLIQYFFYSSQVAGMFTSRGTRCTIIVALRSTIRQTCRPPTTTCCWSCSVRSSLSPASTHCGPKNSWVSPRNTNAGCVSCVSTRFSSSEYLFGHFSFENYAAFCM